MGSSRNKGHPKTWCLTTIYPAKGAMTDLGFNPCFQTNPYILYVPLLVIINWYVHKYIYSYIYTPPFYPTIVFHYIYTHPGVDWIWKCPKSSGQWEYLWKSHSLSTSGQDDYVYTKCIYIYIHIHIYIWV